jgi:hypothetical protein
MPRTTGQRLRENSQHYHNFLQKKKKAIPQASRQTEKSHIITSAGTKQASRQTHKHNLTKQVLI